MLHDVLPHTSGALAPSCPLPFEPQQYALPSSANPQVLALPAISAWKRIVVSSGCGRGTQRQPWIGLPHT